MKNNNPNYSHYVVAKGKIESGWEYKEDAKEHVSENLPDSLKAGAKVVAKSALSRHSIDPENNEHWHTSESIKEAKTSQNTNIVESFYDDGIRKLNKKEVRHLLKGIGYGVSFKQNPLNSNISSSYLKTPSGESVLVSSSSVFSKEWHDEHGPAMKIISRYDGRTDVNESINEAFYDDKKYTHYVVARGKIESGHESKNEASFHHSENLPKHLEGESRVVSRDELKKGYLDPSNKDHWAKTSDLKESFVSILEEGDVFSFSDAIKESLAMKAHIVIENCDKKRLLDAARGGQISEMRDAPDQAMYPLTRREVEKLLTTYERRAELDTNNNDSIEARSEDGMKRARWYAPDVRSDFKYDVEDDMFNPDTRPAALMPYDKHNVKTDDSSTDEQKKKHQDYSGESNLYFHSGGNM